MKNTVYYTDNELLYQWQQGREDGFEALYKRHLNDLIRIADKRIKNIGASREVVQETFIVFFTKKDKISSNPIFYLRQILKFKILKYFETLHKNMVEEYDPLHFSACFEEVGITDTIDEKETSAFISQSLKKLPNQQRQVFLLSRQLNMSNKEIAHEMGISVKGVEAHITKALKHLRKELKYYGILLMGLFSLM